jgi:hypothetical protein
MRMRAGSLKGCANLAAGRRGVCWNSSGSFRSVLPIRCVLGGLGLRPCAAEFNHYQGERSAPYVMFMPWHALAPALTDRLNRFDTLQNNTGRLPRISKINARRVV